MSESGWKVLVLGKGAREHALAARLAASEKVAEVVVAPGNAGTAVEFRNATIANPDDPALVVALAKEEQPDLVVIGPEAPLVNGVADALREAGFAVFGPSRRGAALEGSKVFFKQFAARHNVPTAPFEVFTDPAKAHEFVRNAHRPLVVKADGLCAGKGVVVAMDEDEAHQAIDRMLVDRVFGNAGAVILIEDLVPGNEISVHFLTDSRGYVLLPAAQDHKRLLDGDRGPNTGGMGAYCPAAIVDDALHDMIVERVVEKTILGFHADGIDFRGVVFAGLMITPNGEPVVLEYNVRFGDPETTVLAATVNEDLAVLLMDTAKGTLKEARDAMVDGHAVAVVLASSGYPDSPRTGDVISGIESAHEIETAYVLHAGTKASDKGVVTAGGRVLTVTATGDSLDLALSRAYAACEKISFDGAHYRRDIAARRFAQIKRDS